MEDLVGSAALLEGFPDAREVRFTDVAVVTSAIVVPGEVDVEQQVECVSVLAGSLAPAGDLCVAAAIFAVSPH